MKLSKLKNGAVVETRDGDTDYICISIKNNNGFALPNFTRNTMYKGMEVNKKYTLKELGLFEENKQ